MSDNFNRMLQLAEDFFDAKSDPDQIAVTEEDREKLLALHPASMSEYIIGDGPVVWLLGIPTTRKIMNKFLNAEISEKQLLQETVIGDKFDAVYLCSALVLPEYRHQGLALKVAMTALDAIKKDHPIKYIFTWPFSSEGKSLATAIARKSNLPLLERINK